MLRIEHLPISQIAQASLRPGTRRSICRVGSLGSRLTRAGMRLDHALGLYFEGQLDADGEANFHSYR
jgi:hypothetical protein